MKEKISVPKIGESVESGIIAVWLKADGEAVQDGDELFELETDKATLSVPSTFTGVLTRLAEEGDEVSVGQVVAEIDTEAAPSSGAANASEATAKAEGEELGADFMLQGSINTISDRVEGKEVKYYQVNLELIDIQSQRKAWIGEKKIKKLVKRSRFGF